MRRSQINAAVRDAARAFRKHGWALPPSPRWDVTDFGLGDFRRFGLVLVNLAEEPEYCEKLMFTRRGQVTAEHYHKSKKEDIICRWGRLAVRIHSRRPVVELRVNGVPRAVSTRRRLVLKAGERITLVQRVAHSFWADSSYAVVGEVSTANDDLHDNFFKDRRIGRFSHVIEDEPSIVRLVSDK